MNLSAIEEEALGRCADDYEAPHTIAGDITRDLGRPVSEPEVRAAFLSLAEKGLVHAYHFEASSNRWVAISPADASCEETAWYFISAEGRRVQDEAS